MYKLKIRTKHFKNHMTVYVSVGTKRKKIKIEEKDPYWALSTILSELSVYRQDLSTWDYKDNSFQGNQFIDKDGNRRDEKDEEGGDDEGEK